MKATVFLGGGRITSALIAGLKLAAYRRPIIVHDHNPGKLRELKRRYAVQTEPDLQRAIARAELLIIAVRPDSVRQLLNDIARLDRPGLNKRRLDRPRLDYPSEARPLTAVSLAAGIPLATLRAGLGKFVRWARAMPSPACRSRHGLTALTFEHRFPAAQRRRVAQLFRLVGPVAEIPESKFDAFTVTYSSSHGYHALAALAGAAENLGLDRTSALIAASHALADGILAWREGRVSLDALLHEAATPGGIAATVMSKMDEAGYQRIIQRGLRAGLARARKIRKG